MAEVGGVGSRRRAVRGDGRACADGTSNGIPDAVDSGTRHGNSEQPTDPDICQEAHATVARTDRIFSRSSAAKSGGAARVRVTVSGEAALASKRWHDGDASLPVVVGCVGAVSARSECGSMAAVSGGGVVNIFATARTVSAKEVTQSPLTDAAGGAVPLRRVAGLGKFGTLGAARTASHKAMVRRGSGAIQRTILVARGDGSQASRVADVSGIGGLGASAPRDGSSRPEDGSVPASGRSAAQKRKLGMATSSEIRQGRARCTAAGSPAARHGEPADAGGGVCAAPSANRDREGTALQRAHSDRVPELGAEGLGESAVAATALLRADGATTEVPRPGEALEAPPPVAVADPPVTASNEGARRGPHTSRPRGGASALGERPARQHGSGDGQSRGCATQACAKLREGTDVERRVPKHSRAGRLVGSIVAEPHRKGRVTGARLGAMGWTLDRREQRAAAVEAPCLPSEGAVPRAGEAERRRADAALEAAVDD